MTPNLFLATQTLFSPHKWFRSAPKGERAVRVQEHWDDPVPGVYEYIPGRGWYLIATDKDAGDASPNPSNANSRPASRDALAAQIIKDVRSESKHTRNASTASVTKPEWQKSTVPMRPPLPVKYSKVLKRYLLATDYDIRKKHGRIQGTDGKYRTVGFFRLDDGIAWVQCWDEEGEFIPGPYKLWCIDRESKEYRHMLKGDDPAYVSRQNSLSGEGNELGRRSRRNSPRRTSQDSRSTQFRPGPGSASKDGISVPSTRPNSIKTPGASTSQFTTPSRDASRAGSAANSRRGSPRRAAPGQMGGVQLEEAKERLKAMAREQAERSRSRASSNEEAKRGRAKERD